jgi:hypothetical protein
LSNIIKRDSLNHLSISPLHVLGKIGDTMAILHFGAHLDGDDVEFVLGGGEDSEVNFCVWLLDFDRCKFFDDGGRLERFADVLRKSDLTIPKARTTDEGHSHFKDGYLSGASKFIAEEDAQRVIHFLEQTQSQKDEEVNLRTKEINLRREGSKVKIFAAALGNATDKGAANWRRR